MIKEMSSARLAALRQTPIQIDTWTNTPAPDARVNRWELYRESEVDQLISLVKAGKNVIVSGQEQAGKSTMMVESYFALLAGSTPTYGFSTRVLLGELPHDNGTNQEKIMTALNRIPEGQVVMVDNVDYLFRTFKSMMQHSVDGSNYTDKKNEAVFNDNCAVLLSKLSSGQFRLIFSLHNDWPQEWVDQNRYHLWLNSLGDSFDSIELNACLEPAKAAAFLTMERGMDLTETDKNSLVQVLGIIPFAELKRKPVAELQKLLKF